MWAFVVFAFSALCYRILEVENGPTTLVIATKAGAIDLVFTGVVLPYGVNWRVVAEHAR
mgnify:CR=1 FL=1